MCSARVTQLGGMSDFKKLLVWQKAHALALHSYRVAKRMRHSSDVSLRSQIIRAATSIPANIVEGLPQATDKEFARFLRISVNSAYELEYHLVLARDMALVPTDDATDLLSECSEVRRMLHGLLNRLGKSQHPTKKLSA